MVCTKRCACSKIKYLGIRTTPVQKTKLPYFDGDGLGQKVDTWLIDMKRRFARHPYSSNVSAFYLGPSPLKYGSLVL